MATASLWICLRTHDQIRRFLRIGAARDGSVYTTIGRPIKGATIYRGEIQMPTGVTAVSQDYTTNPSQGFVATEQQHTGFKSSGGTRSSTVAATRSGRSLRFETFVE
jgi:hypothetical protein